MIRKTAIGMIIAAGLLAGSSGAIAQTASSPVRCMYTWCWTHVMVVPDAAGTPVARVTWNEFRMPKNLSGVTLGWILVGSPDYELRPDSVVIIGANTAGASAQFPLRQSTVALFPADDLNTTDLVYTYQLRVYKKGSPPDAVPLVVSGTIANSVN
jgi:hypothetical protein